MPVIHHQSNDEFQINPQENVHLPLTGELCNWANEFQINQNILTFISLL